MYLWFLLFVAILFVLVVVVMGFLNVSFAKGGSKRSNKLMAIRVAAQAISLLILFVIWFVYKAQ